MREADAISFKVDRKLREALERAALADHRSVEALVQIILHEWLTNNGYLQRRT
jgi:hypothetical protein